MDYRKKLVVEPGARVKLADFDPGFKPRQVDKVAARKELAKLMVRLDELQYRMFAEHKRSLLIVLQGLDASGKDGTVRRVIAAMNPAGCRVTNFKQPTPRELDHDFLWRVHPHVPRRGDVAVFNRSHYEDVLIARVHGLVPKSVWSRRYELINGFEKSLHVESDTTVLKFFLHISKEEQLARFARRLQDPVRQWKISESDYKERKYWDDYVEAFEEVFARTSTEHAPWFVIPSNSKWFRNLAIAHILVEALEAMNIALPRPSVDVERIRKLFHEVMRNEVSLSS